MQGLHATPLVRLLYATPPPQPRGQLLQGLLLLLLLLLLLQAQLMRTMSDVCLCVFALSAAAAWSLVSSYSSGVLPTPTLFSFMLTYGPTNGQ
jgi:hypothetical protein